MVNVMGERRQLTGEEILSVAQYFAGYDKRDEDLVQFIALEIIVALKRYDPQKGTIGAFLRSRLRYSRIDYYREYKPFFQYDGARLRESTSKFELYPYDTAENFDREENGRTNSTGNQHVRFYHLQSQVAEITAHEDDHSVLELSSYVAVLPKRTREILYLYAFECLTRKEIGQYYKISEARVCQIIWRAKDYLQNANSKSSSALPMGLLPQKPLKSYRSVPKPSNHIGDISFRAPDRAL